MLSSSSSLKSPFFIFIITEEEADMLIGKSWIIHYIFNYDFATILSYFIIIILNNNNNNNNNI